MKNTADDTVDEVFLTSAQLKRRYGGIADMTIWRWMNDKQINFPRPISIAKRRLWRRSDLEQYERSLVRRRRA